MYGETMAILTVVSFALSFVLARKIENEATPLFQNAIRSIIGFITFLTICLSLGIFFKIFSLSILIILFLSISILFTVILGDTAYLHSQKILGPAKALAITTTTPFFTILFAILFLNRPISVQMVFSGILIGIGVIVITKEKDNNFGNKEAGKEESSKKFLPKVLKGTFLALFTAISWAIGTSLTDYSITQVDTLLNIGILSTMIAMMIRFLFASILLSSITIVERKKIPIPKNRNTWIILIISAMLSYSIGSIFFGEAVHTVGAVFVSLISTAMPLFTIPFSYIINKEKLSLRGFIGVVITFIGVIIILF
ncbi:MAG: DMT family transporter [Candidatus Hodarchaeota archaeon]